MRAARTLLVTLAAALVPGGGAASADAADAVALSLDRTRVSTQLGRSFVVRATVRNDGTSPLAGRIAHLDVVSLRDGVYVDPEDWSSQRTRYLGAVPAGAAVTTTWRIDAVNAGRFAVYITLLSRRAGEPPLTAAPVTVAVAQRRAFDPAGIVPLALGIPSLLGATALGLRLRRRAVARAEA